MKRLAALGLVLLASCFHGAAPEGFGRASVTFTQGSHRLTLQVEVATTPILRAEGLSGRASVPAGTGMLFTYPEPVAGQGYWMKDTLVPLDIAFARAGRVIEVDHMVPCHADPCAQTTPAGAFDWVIEAAAGTFAPAGIGPGAAVAYTD